MAQEKQKMISYEDALAMILKNANPRPGKKKPLPEALGNVAAQDVVSAIQVPGFRNSAMDGFAVVSNRIASASQSNHVALPIAAAIAAGERTAVSDVTKAVQIMTGAAVPEPYDTVVPVELVTVRGGNAIFTAPAHCGDHIRRAGEDVASGQIVLRKGERITPEAIMLLAAVGIDSVAIAEAPCLHIISTGNEISDDYAALLTGAQIYNSNAPYLLAEARKQALEARYEGIVRDDPAFFEAKLKAVSEPAIVISTGAVSKGVWDFIPDTLRKLGAVTHFHRVNIRPGKPVLFATLPNGNYYFGLPGNPISAAIGFTFFVMPLVCALQERALPEPLTAKLVRGFRKKGDFQQFLKARLLQNRDGQLIADIVDGQESFKISPMSASNAWVVLEAESREWHTGDMVMAVPYGEIIRARKEASLCQAA